MLSVGLFMLSSLLLFILAGGRFWFNGSSSSSEVIAYAAAATAVANAASLALLTSLIWPENCLWNSIQVKNSFIIARKTRGTQLDVTEDIQLFDTETAPRKGETDHDYEALYLICFHRLSKLVQNLELVWSLQIDTSRREGSIWTFIRDQAWKQSQAWIINVDEMEFWTRKLRHCFHMQVLESICIWMRKKGITFLVFPQVLYFSCFRPFLPAEVTGGGMFFSHQ
ncbi:unnamed protein product [Musa acuminata subsp. burmannicoides]